jgi:hypothetical protein
MSVREVVKDATWLCAGDQVHSGPEIDESGTEEGVPTLLHFALALALTFFLAYQARSLALVLRSHRTHAAPGRRSRPMSALVWTVIPVVVVLVLAARSWLALVDVDRPAIASSAAGAAPVVGARSIAAPPAP